MFKLFVFTYIVAGFIFGFIGPTIEYAMVSIAILIDLAKAYPIHAIIVVSAVFALYFRKSKKDHLPCAKEPANKEDGIAT